MWITLGSMSIFKVKEFWSTSIAGEYDVGGLVCGSLDRHDGGSMIATGSFGGLLRIYSPSRREYKADDLILEEDLDYPILQMKMGKFLAGSDDMALAVLHPRKLTVYELSKGTLENDDDDGGTTVYKLEKHYDNLLGLDGEHFSAFCMCTGVFGNGGGQEMIIVQSIDGKLQIFEGQNLVFTRQFVDCLYPGPLEYLQSLDAFVTVNTACEAQCVRYQNFVSSQKDIGANSDAGGKTGSFGITAMKSNVFEWSTVVGEHCLYVFSGMFVGQGDNDRNNKQTGVELMLVGESSLHVLSDGGRLKSQKKLDQNPVCACSYPSGTGILDNLAVATQEGNLHIFSELCLIWAARLDSVPVALTIAGFADHDGMIVALDETGRLSISYLGTRPPSSIASSAASRDLDYERIDEEHRQLLMSIREHQSETKTEPKDRIIIRTQLPKELDMGAQGPETDIDMPEGLVTLGDALEEVQSSQLLKVCVRLFIAYTGSASVTNVNISVSTPRFCHVVPKSCVLKEVKANSTPQLVRLYLYASKDELAQSLSAEVCVTYQAQSGEHRVASHTFGLPIFLACALRAPVKSAEHKFTLDTGDLPAQPATTLFEDLVVASHEAGVDVAEMVGHTEQAVGLQLWRGHGEGHQEPAVVSVLVSKTSGRYRVQSDCLPALALVLSEVRRRLELTFKEEKEAGRRVVTCGDALPLPLFFDEIDLHLAARHSLRDTYSALNDLAHLYRVVEKRLLTRFKEKNATALGGLDDVLNDTYAKLTGAADAASEAQRELALRHRGIDGMARVLVELATMRGDGREEQQREVLLAYLCPSLLAGKGSCSGELEGTGWEEMCETGLTYLLKTTLAQKSDPSYRVTGKAPSMPEDSGVLKQRVTLLFDRLDEGGSLAPS